MRLGLKTKSIHPKCYSCSRTTILEVKTTSDQFHCLSSYRDDLLSIEPTVS